MAKWFGRRGRDKDEKTERMPGEPVSGMSSTSAYELAIQRGLPVATDGHGVGVSVGKSVKGDKQRGAKQRGRQERHAEARGGKTWKKGKRGEPTPDYSCDIDQTTSEAKVEVNQAYRDTFLHDYDPDDIHIGTPYDYP